jgi:hypothetical protein
VKTCATAGIVGDDEGWVTTPAVSQRLCFARRVSGAVSSSSVGLEEGVLVASSLAYQVSACRDYFRCIRFHQRGHWERFFHALSSAVRYRTPAPCQKSCSPSVYTCQHALICSWAEVVGHLSLPMMVLLRSPFGCCKDSNANINLDYALHSKFALLCTEFL